MGLLNVNKEIEQIETKNRVRDTLKRIHILMMYVNKELMLYLETLENTIRQADKVTDDTFIDYIDIENKVLRSLPAQQRIELYTKLKDLDDSYSIGKLRKGLCPSSDLFTPVTYRLDEERLNNIEEKLHQIIARPRLYEKRAEEKLLEIDDKFRKLMEISDRNTSITDNIKKENEIEKKLSKLEADAQDMMSDISTIELGKQYLEAKNRYCTPKSKMKFSRSKHFYVRYPANIYYWFLWIFKRVFHNDFFLYTGFILSLMILTLSYFIVIFGNNQNTYKDLVITIPMIWLAWFFQRKINTRDKLFELYNHKQKVMETYVAFKNSAYDFKASDKMEEVLLEAIKKDPSDCIGKDNTTIIEAVLDKMRGIFITAKAKKIVKDEIDLVK